MKVVDSVNHSLSKTKSTTLNWTTGGSTILEELTNGAPTPHLGGPVWEVVWFVGLIFLHPLRMCVCWGCSSGDFVEKSTLIQYIHYPRLYPRFKLPPSEPSDFYWVGHHEYVWGKEHLNYAEYVEVEFPETSLLIGTVFFIFEKLLSSV